MATHLLRSALADPPCPIFALLLPTIEIHAMLGKAHMTILSLLPLVYRQFRHASSVPPGVAAVRIYLIAGLFLVALISACEKSSDPTPAPSAPKVGFTLTPRSSSPADFQDLFSLADNHAQILSWAGDWAELADTSSAPHVVAALASVYDYQALIAVQFFHQNTGQLIRPLDSSTQALYTVLAASFVTRRHPAYFALGIEVNTLAAKSPGDYATYLPLFARIADTINLLSPATVLLVNFQLEQMKGLQGGLFGGVNDTTQHQWSLLNDFPAAEMVSFTTYPSLIYSHPDSIPADYYSAVRDHTSLPIGFTEIGWHSAADVVGWESSESEQADFVALFKSSVQPLHSPFLIWSFVYDPPAAAPFNSMGLRRLDYSPRPAWTEWVP